MARLIRKDIQHQQVLKADTKSPYRDVVRGIILDGSNLLMVYSPRNGDFRFPGGGVEAGETHAEALRREIAEECGAQLLTMGLAYAVIKELDDTPDEDTQTFRMISTYYLGQVSPVFGPQILDDDEKALGFQPVWINIQIAIQTNSAVLQRKSPPAPRWTLRDFYVLQEIDGSLNSGQLLTMS
jgi:ADP-ribose pyrophosphatase YjhB (NUDIX family)